MIHSWAGNASALMLPRGFFIQWAKAIQKTRESLFYLDFGIAVGRNTPYKYIIVNIHYVSVVEHDNSGNQLVMSRKPYLYCFYVKVTYSFLL